MTTKLTVKGSCRVYDYIPDIPHMKKPVIVRTEIIEGIKYHFCNQGKQYLASLFDKIFETKKSVMKKKYYKGQNPNLKNVA